MKNPSQLLPLKIGDFQVRKISWGDFKGQIDEQMPWSAHIYWWIDYKIQQTQKKRVFVQLHLSDKSWVKPDKKCAHLLNHEQDHYLIGALCALQFMRRIDSKKKNFQGIFEDLVNQTFDRTMKEYLQLQKRYDDETQHRLHFNKQLQWDCFIFDRLTYYKQTYDKGKKRFVKFSESPSKIKGKTK